MPVILGERFVAGLVTGGGVAAPMCQDGRVCREVDSLAREWHGFADVVAQGLLDVALPQFHRGLVMSELLDDLKHP